MKPAGEICNPAWGIWTRVHGSDREKFSWHNRLLRDDPLEMAGQWMSAYRLRSLVIDHMTFAIPDPYALDLVARHGPIIEIGAGTGYWAWCLRQMGVDVIAFDRYPPQTHPRDDDRSKGRNGWFNTYWTDIRRGTENQAGRYPERSLLMVWPYMDDMAVRALKFYRGQTLIYVGEERAACANEAFFEELERNWTTVESIFVPQWEGLNDELWIMKRDKP